MQGTRRPVKSREFIGDLLLSGSWTEARERVGEWLERWLFTPASGISLSPACAELVRYSLLPPGKALRPSLYLVCLSGLGVPMESGRNGALALECVHTYSLIHDDLPCMDDDDLRRGRPSAHVRFSEAEAVLSGDALLTLSFELLGNEAPEVAGAMVKALAIAAGGGGMVDGQLLDMAATGCTGSESACQAIHERKTAALIGAAMSMAAIRARRPPEEVLEMKSMGEDLGLIFQLVDDILDVDALAGELGKTTGKDAAQGKLTYPAAVGMEKSKEILEKLVASALARCERLPLENSGEIRSLIHFLHQRRH
ncbi:MAG: polyprenyl synthetase family protein [Planctomycetes bacterium]|nr:polyprenyl synthetase family protein [Planctomycetota bacterium]